MSKSLKIFALTIIFTLFFNDNSYSEIWWNSKMPESYLIGTGKLKVFFWDVYNLKLFSSSKAIEKADDLVLEFQYLRDVSKKSIIDASIKELKKNTNFDKYKLGVWEQYLEKSIRDMLSGEKAALHLSMDKKITFFIKGEKEVTFHDKEFGNAYINIWLGENTSKPELRKKLLGIISVQ